MEKVISVEERIRDFFHTIKSALGMSRRPFVKLSVFLPTKVIRVLLQS